MLKTINQVVFVTIAMGGGGTERVIAVLANYLAERGTKVTILMIAGEEVVYPLHPDVIVKQVGKKSNGSLITRLERIYAIRNEFISSSPCNIVAMGTVCSIFSLIANLGIQKNRMIVSERNNPNRVNGKPYSKKLEWLRNFLYNKADVCVFQTEDAQKYFPDYLQKKGCVIENPIAEGIPEAFAGKRQKKVVTAGRLIPEKNQKLLIDAFAEFVRTHKDYYLEIYGSGILHDELCKLIRDYQLENCAQIIEFTDKLHQCIADSAMFISTSNGEGISNAILEAMALGIPTIATDCPIGGSKMIIRDGIDGILIPVGDKDKLIENMNKLANDETYAEQLSHNAISVRERFSRDCICEKWISLLI